MKEFFLSRGVQILSRYIAVALTAVAMWLTKAQLDEGQAVEVNKLSTEAAMFIISGILFLFDHWSHNRNKKPTDAQGRLFDDTGKGVGLLLFVMFPAVVLSLATMPSCVSSNVSPKPTTTITDEKLDDTGPKNPLVINNTGVRTSSQLPSSGFRITGDIAGVKSGDGATMLVEPTPESFQGAQPGSASMLWDAKRKVMMGIPGDASASLIKITQKDGETLEIKDAKITNSTVLTEAAVVFKALETQVMAATQAEKEVAIQQLQSQVAVASELTKAALQAAIQAIKGPVP